MLRIIHTSDWHLGHTLHDLSRDYEHVRFLRWLVDTLESEAADALIVSGDVFDSANPSAIANRRWYELVAEARRRMPRLDIVAIGGNHDSAARLDAPDEMFRALGVHVVGAVRRCPGGGIDADRMIVPLRDAAGEVRALCAAVPYLRQADLPPAVSAEVDPLIDGVRRVYAEVLDRALERREPGQAVVATGHCYMVGGKLSRLSERRVLGGNQHALPVDIFPEDVAYVALGHLHKAQRVAGRDRVRYCGAPIALSMGEGRYRHQVLAVDLEGEACVDVRAIPVPRAVDVLRLPSRGAAPLPEVLAELLALPARPADVSEEQRPFLEVTVLLDAPEPGLRREVEAALAGKLPRLVAVHAEYTGNGMPLGDIAPGMRLEDLEPHEVFVGRYRRDHDGDVPAVLARAFDELIAEVESARERS